MRTPDLQCFQISKIQIYFIGYKKQRCCCSYAGKNKKAAPTIVRTAFSIKKKNYFCFSKVYL